ncbi:zinc finger, C2H2 type [Oesophagostomum dentatum]|uniref:Zinc finger, C2H2 type n=1 Tax=Oesophagostomum dentatum TaxID=61180 RepID=A0A0B1SM24_OESDE|nr:zinc finger, C2H2 type [Oesophagostomum dentatum]
MGLIVDPKRYIEHWRQRFAKESVDQIFPRVEPKEGEKYFGETDYYYNMSEMLPEDYSLRQRLAMRRLEEALSCQQRERDDANFQQQCIFCRYTARGNRSKIIHHLYMIHHLNLGSPDNLVFVTEYIEHLKEKLQRNECIYCEKTFGDRNILMDHMRKRNHREVNPKNHYYDKFYIINYLELGKRWLDVLAEDFEDTMPTFQDSDEEEEDNSWCEWLEDNLDVDETRVVCLLCNESDETCEGLLSHMKEKHEFDLIKLIDDNRLDVYQRMKLINFIRKQNFNAVCFVCQRNDLGNTQELAKHLQETEKPITV